MANIGKQSTRYIWQGLVISLILTAFAYTIVTSVKMPEKMLEVALQAMYISLGFFMLVNIVEALVWRRVAERSPESLPTFFTAVSGFRMLLALAVLFVYYLACGREAMLPFFVVFAVYYVAQLVHHSYFFSKVSNHLDELNNK